MSRKRRRPVDAAAAAPPLPPPPAPPLAYFCYTPAPGSEDGPTETESNRGYHRQFLARNGRGDDYHRVDEVDVPAPAEWLCHDAAASAKLRAQAQTELQLLTPPASRLPHSQRPEWQVRGRDAGLVAAVHSTVAGNNRNAKGREMRPGRVLCGGELLPWGTWPARLRHHEGQSFYQEGGAPYWAGGGGVGRSGGVGGVGVVDEGAIHDELLRRRLAPSSAFGRSSHRHNEDAAVTRLVPDRRGRWAQAKTVATSPVAAAAATAASAAAAAAALPQEISVGPDDSPRPDAPPRARSATAPAGSGSGLGGVVIPGRYGGWVELEKAKGGARKGTEQGRRGRTAALKAARFGPAVDDDSGDGQSGSGSGVPDAALPSSYLEEESYARRMVAEAAAEAAKAVPGHEHSFTAGAGACGRGKEKAGDCEVGGNDAHHGCRRQGWKVSVPATEAVRRVWNRARRRARDSFEPRHRAARAGGDSPEEGAPADCGPIRDALDPGLLSCLGRECEGIIDAALHVVLADRLDVLREPSSPAALSAHKGRSNPGPPPPPLPPPLVTADWQDVLRAMQKCSESARGVRTSATLATQGGDNSRHKGKERVNGGGGGEASAGGRGREAGGVVPGLRAIERAVWGAGSSSDGSVVVVNERLPGLPLNEAVLTRAYNRLLLYLHEKKPWQA